jgi:hypothetical protein
MANNLTADNICCKAEFVRFVNNLRDSVAKSETPANISIEEFTPIASCFECSSDVWLTVVASVVASYFPTVAQHFSGNVQSSNKSCTYHGLRALDVIEKFLLPQKKTTGFYLKAPPNEPSDFLPWRVATRIAALFIIAELHHRQDNIAAFNASCAADNITVNPFNPLQKLRSFESADGAPCYVWAEAFKTKFLSRTDPPSAVPAGMARQRLYTAIIGGYTKYRETISSYMPRGYAAEMALTSGDAGGGGEAQEEAPPKKKMCTQLQTVAAAQATAAAAATASSSDRAAMIGAAVNAVFEGRDAARRAVAAEVAAAAATTAAASVKPLIQVCEQMKVQVKGILREKGFNDITAVIACLPPGPPWADHFNEVFLTGEILVEEYVKYCGDTDQFEKALKETYDLKTAAAKALRQIFDNQVLKASM